MTYASSLFWIAPEAGEKDPPGCVELENLPVPKDQTDQHQVRDGNQNFHESALSADVWVGLG